MNRGARGIIIAGVVLLLTGAIVWWRAAAARERATIAAAYEKAFGWDPAPVSSGAVWFGVGILAFGALAILTGVGLAVAKSALQPRR